MGFEAKNELELFLKSLDFVLLQNPENEQLGIEQVRELQKNLSLKPYLYRYKIVLIEKANLFSIPAQNALLKTVEEPPSQSGLILLSREKEWLLPTIVSRCNLVSLGIKPEKELTEKELATCLDELRGIITGSLSEKFRIAEIRGKTKEDALAWLEEICFTAHTELIKYHTKGEEQNIFDFTKLKKFLENSLKTKKHLSANVNPRFALENLFLTC